MDPVACVMTIVDGVMHPSIFYDVSGPNECDLDYLPR